jgi:hypothetical protein
MSHDLVAVQRDAALIDDLAQRARPTADDRDTDPVVSLPAALAADVDEVLLDAAVAVFAPRIPEQGRRDGGTVAAPGAAVAGGSRAATPVRDKRGSWNGRDRDREGWDRQGWDRHDRASRHRDGSFGGDGSRSSHNTSGSDRTGHSDSRDASHDPHDSYGHGHGSGDSRR